MKIMYNDNLQNTEDIGTFKSNGSKDTLNKNLSMMSMTDLHE